MFAIFAPTSDDDVMLRLCRVVVDYAEFLQRSELCILIMVSMQ